MTTPDGRAALQALAVGRPAVARLGPPGLGTEEAAADLIEVWSAVETALRALLGGSSLAGQPLIREARQRQVITLHQTHALLDFLAARERVNDTSYLPTASDAAVAREAFRLLDEGLSVAESAGPRRASATVTPADVASVVYGAGDPEAVEHEGGRNHGLILLVSLLVLAAIGIAAALYTRHSGPADVRRGADLYAAGRRPEARQQFETAARDHPEMAMPHVYLGRIAREQGDTTEALDQLTTAVRLEPANAVALREMGSLLLARGQLDLARNFYVRALKADPADSVAQGWLGCTLVRLGRLDEGIRFLQRAGTGPWAACAGPAPGGTAPPSR